MTGRLLEAVTGLAAPAGLLAIQVTLALLGALLVDVLARRRGWPPVVRQVAWIAVLVRMLWLVPLRGVRIPVGWTGAAPLPGGMTETVAVAGATPAGTPDDAGIGPASWLLLAWAAGATLCLVFLLVRIVLARREVARQTRPAGGHVREALVRATRATGLRTIPRLRLVPAGSRLPAPALLGVVRPVVLLPDTAETWPDAVLEPVLLHECIHLRRRDPLLALAAAVARAAWFFHPLSWLATARLAAVRELLCDAEVVRRLGNDRSYLAALVRVAEEKTAQRRAVAFVGLAETARGLRGRIETMIRNRRADGRWGRMALAAALALAVAVPLVTGTLATRAGTDGGENAAPREGPWIPGRDGVTEPVLVHRVRPVYPEKAKKRRIEGKVIFQIVIREDGTVGEVKVLKEPAADLGFREAAVAAVKQWRYRPATKDGKPVPVYFTVVVKFRLDEEAPDEGSRG